MGLNQLAGTLPRMSCRWRLVSSKSALVEQLEQLEFPREHVLRARLAVRLELDRVPWQETGERAHALWKS